MTGPEWGVFIVVYIAFGLMYGGLMWMYNKDPFAKRWTDKQWARVKLSIPIWPIGLLLWSLLRLNKFGRMIGRTFREAFGSD